MMQILAIAMQAALLQAAKPTAFEPANGCLTVKIAALYEALLVEIILRDIERRLARQRSSPVRHSAVVTGLVAFCALLHRSAWV